MKGTPMRFALFDRGLVGIGLAAALAMLSGCVHEEQGPEPWAAQPVVLAVSDASNVKVRIDNNFVLTGRESEEVSDHTSLRRSLPEALTEKLTTAGFKVVAAGEPTDLVLTVASKDLEWTGHFWEARGHVIVSLSRPSADGPSPPPSNESPKAEPKDFDAPNPLLVAKTVAGFDHCDSPHVAQVIATSATEQFTRSGELATWVRNQKH